jgi:hypothetical protein
VGKGLDPTGQYVRATTWLPVVVGALLVAIVAIFIFGAPNQIVTPKDNGYLIASSPAPPVETAMQ